MTIWYRMLFWLTVWFAIATAYLVSAAIDSLSSTDPSAGAWIGFLPFFIPFALRDAAWIWCLAVFAEVVLIVRK